MNRAEDALRLCGARVTVDSDHAEHKDLIVHNGFLSLTEECIESETQLDLSGTLILPGLINAHDHLEFSLFPRQGLGPYKNYVDWAHDIYHPHRSPLKELLAVPKKLRLIWGGLKNLLSGVTTVAHHNHYDSSVFGGHFPTKVVRKYGWAHSLHFTHNLRDRFVKTPNQWPFVIHAAEGVDALARSEIARLTKLEILDSRTVLVHCVGLEDSDLETLRQKRCSIVWCPSSNLFTCGTTLSGELLDSPIPIALGTDSPLTAEGDMGDEICAALRSYPGIIDRIFSMVTWQPASILGLPLGSGTIREGSPADLVAVQDRERTPAESLPHLFPELVIVAGRIRLISRRLLSQNPHLRSSSWQPLVIEGKGEAFVDVDVKELSMVTSDILGTSFRLAHRRVLS